MILNSQRSPTLVDGYDFNTLHSREHNTNLNTKNYLLSKSPTPMSYRDLRLVVTNRIPSNILILPKAISSSSTSINSSVSQRTKTKHKKNHKQTGFDVYRSLARSVSHSSVTPERDNSNDETTGLANSFTIDRISLLPTAGWSRPPHLPKIQKHHTNNKIKINHTSFPSSSSSNSMYMHAAPEIFHRTTPTNQYYDEDKDQMTTSTKVSSYVPKNRTRKQLHVYIPQISC